MPDNTVAIIGVIGSTTVVPSLAAYVALRIHGERLAHERQLADTAELRRVLDSGAELLRRAEDTAQAMYNKTGPEAAQISLRDELADYNARLLLWVPLDDPLSELWRPIMRSYSTIQHPGGGVDVTFHWGMLASQSEAWQNAARERVGVRS